MVKFERVSNKNIERHQQTDSKKVKHLEENVAPGPDWVYGKILKLLKHSI